MVAILHLPSSCPLLTPGGCFTVIHKNGHDTGLLGKPGYEAGWRGGCPLLLLLELSHVFFKVR